MKGRADYDSAEVAQYNVIGPPINRAVRAGRGFIIGSFISFAGGPLSIFLTEHRFTTGTALAKDASERRHAMAIERSTGTVKAPRGTIAKAGSIISFDPDRIVRGLVFHLLDDKHAEHVSDASIRNARERLKKKDLRLAIMRELWEAMSHRERFEWLLARSRTQVIYSGRTAILAADR